MSWPTTIANEITEMDLYERKELIHGIEEAEQEHLPEILMDMLQEISLVTILEKI